MQTNLFPTATLSFTDFWSIFPRKTAKQISEKAWRKLSVSNQKKAISDCGKEQRRCQRSLYGSSQRRDYYEYNRDVFLYRKRE